MNIPINISIEEDIPINIQNFNDNYMNAIHNLNNRKFIFLNEIYQIELFIKTNNIKSGAYNNILIDEKK